MNNIIEINSLTKIFKGEKVLNNINLTFEKAKIHGIIGRNGSGKSLLFKSICGFLPIDNGYIKVNDKVIGKDIDVPENTGIIIETPGFMESASGLKNLLFLANINKTIDKQTIINTMNIVGLDANNKKPVSKYSLGMRQRLAIAQAIMENPNLLILDEPMNGLDKNGLTDMRILLKKLKSEGKTILITSHNSSDIEILCDTVHEMEKGEIIA